MTTQTPKSN